MTVSTLIRLLRKNLLWLVLFPLVLAVTVAYLTKSLPRDYQASASVYTGMVSGYSITNADGAKIDNSVVNNAFDNLFSTVKSRATMGEVGKRLLTQHLLLEKPNPLILSQESLKKLHELVDERTRRQIVVPGNMPATFRRIDSLARADDNNIVKKLIYNSSTHYSAAGIMGKVGTSRKSASDILELSYKSDDPGVCQHTLLFVIETFRNQYTNVKSEETANVIHYFEEEVRKAQQRLRNAEDSLRDYGVSHDVIDYDSQSKSATTAKEQLTDEYHNEQMKYRATRLTLDTLESRLSERSSVMANNRELLARRTELSSLQNQLANAQVYDYPPEKVAELKSRINKLSEDLKNSARRYYSYNNTLEALPQSSVLNEWFAKLMESQQSAARLSSLEKRLRETDGIYKQLAPVGLTIERMKRQVDMAEKEYTTALGNLNQARLRQKNIEMSGPLRVLDPPVFPTNPEPSKRMVFIAASFGAGLVLMLAFILGRELLIPSIKAPELFQSKTDLPLASAMPLVSRKTRGYDLPHIERCMVEQLRSVILIESEQRKDVRTQVVILFSPRKQQGRTWVGERISHQFAQLGFNVCYLYPGDLSTDPPSTQAKRIRYPSGIDLAHINRVDDFVAICDPSPLARTAQPYDFVFFELPALLETAIPARLVRQATLSLMIIKGNTMWVKADKIVCRLYEKAATSPIMGVLNAVEPDRLTSLLGFQPKSKLFGRKRTGKSTINSNPKPVRDESVRA